MSVFEANGGTRCAVTRHDSAMMQLCASRLLSERASVDVVVLSGGVIQNALLLDDLHAALGSSGIELWINHDVPPNDGGLSLGQAALALGQEK